MNAHSNFHAPGHVPGLDDPVCGKCIAVIFFLSLLLVAFSFRATAQVELRFQLPPPGSFNPEDFVELISFNNPLPDVIPVFMTTTLEEETKGLVFQATTSVFEIAPGFSAPSYNVYEPISLGYHNTELERHVAQTSTIPPGEYVVCARLVHVETEMEIGFNCAPVSVFQPSAPVLVYPANGDEVLEPSPVFNWLPPSPPPPADVFYRLRLVEVHNGQSPFEAMEANPAFYQEEKITDTSLPFPPDAVEMAHGKIFAWRVQAYLENGFPVGMNNGFSNTEVFNYIPVSDVDFGPVEPGIIPQGPGDPCEDPKYVEKEEKECADIIWLEVNVPLNSIESDFDEFKKDWKMHFFNLKRLIDDFDQELSMIKYWIKAGNEIEEEAKKVQKLANIFRAGIGKGTTAYKKGGEEALKDVAVDFTKDRFKDIQQYAVENVSETLGALYDLEDIAIRQIGLGIAKGLTGVHPDREADYHRRRLQFVTTKLSEWVSERCNRNTGYGEHPTLQDGINDMCNMLDQLNNIENNFNKAVQEAGFICITCEIPENLLEEIAKLRMEIDLHIQSFIRTIDHIRDRLAIGRAIANNKKAYKKEDLLSYYQHNSGRQTREINKVLKESERQLKDALR